MKSLLSVSAVAIFVISIAGIGRAEPIVLKSGARGDLSASIATAPVRFGGPSAGNFLELKVALKGGMEPNLTIDGRSVCHLHGLKMYWRIRTGSTLPAELRDLIDLNAPLVGVRVTFMQESATGISVGTFVNFDMRGVVKCRPFE